MGLFIMKLLKYDENSTSLTCMSDDGSPQGNVNVLMDVVTK